MVLILKGVINEIIMLTNKKYKSDRLLKPALLIMALSIPAAYYTSQPRIIVMGLLVLVTTVVFGITSYRYGLEKNRKYAILNIVALFLFYAFIICGVKFLNIKL